MREDKEKRRRGRRRDAKEKRGGEDEKQLDRGEDMHAYANHVRSKWLVEKAHAVEPLEKVVVIVIVIGRGGCK